MVLVASSVDLHAEVDCQGVVLFAEKDQGGHNEGLCLAHLDDSVRFAFRIGFWVLIFAIFSIALLIASLLVSVLSFVRTS